MHVILQDLVHERLSQLSCDVRSIIECAAAIGYRIDAQLLQAATGAAPQRLAAALRSACQLDLMIDECGDATRFRFRHALTRAAVYVGIDGGRKRRLHAAVARALENLPNAGNRAPELAHHWSSAGRVGKARRYQRIAADEARLLDSVDQLRGGL